MDQKDYSDRQIDFFFLQHLRNTWFRQNRIFFIRFNSKNNKSRDIKCWINDNITVFLRSYNFHISHSLYLTQNPALFQLFLFLFVILYIIGVLTRQGHQSAITAVEVTSDSEKVVSSDKAGVIAVWLSDNGTLLNSVICPATNLSVTNNMKYLVSGDGHFS